MEAFGGGAADAAGFVNPTYSSTGISVAGGAVATGKFYDPAAAPLLSPYSVIGGHTLFFHAAFAYNDGFNFYGTYDAIILFDASGAPWLKLRTDGQLQYNSITLSQLALAFFMAAGDGAGGAANAANFTYLGPAMDHMPPTPINAIWLNIGSPIGAIGAYNYNAGVGNPGAIDIKVDIDTGGNHKVTIFRDAAIALPPTNVSQPLMKNLAQFALTGDNRSSAQQRFSEVIASEDLSTLGAHVCTSLPASAGTYHEWAGVFGDLVDSSDTTANTAASATLRQSYNMSNVAVPAGSIVAGVFNWMRARSNGGSPANIEAKLIAGGTEYNTVNLPAVQLGYSTIGSRYDTNPATGIKWVQSDWNAPVQLGAISEA